MIARGQSSIKSDALSQAVMSSHFLYRGLANGHLEFSSKFAVCPVLSKFCTKICDTWNENTNDGEANVFAIKLYCIAPQMKNSTSTQLPKRVVPKRLPQYRVWVGLSDGESSISNTIRSMDNEFLETAALVASAPPIHALFGHLDYSIDRISFCLHTKKSVANFSNDDPLTMHVSVPLLSDTGAGNSSNRKRRVAKRNKRPTLKVGKISPSCNLLEDGGDAALFRSLQGWLDKNAIAAAIEMARKRIPELSERLEILISKGGLLNTSRRVLEKHSQKTGRDALNSLFVTALISPPHDCPTAIAMIYSSKALSSSATGYFGAILPHIARMVEAATKDENTNQAGLTDHDTAQRVNVNADERPNRLEVQVNAVNRSIIYGEKTLNSFTKTQWEMLKFLYGKTPQPVSVGDLYNLTPKQNPSGSEITKRQAVQTHIKDLRSELRKLESNHQWIKLSRGEFDGYMFVLPDTD